jgi:tRNA nucleotidyltransferase (CCA-adding enzyme)
VQVITTHLNANFDCLASMMAAKKLYPEACLVLPGPAEHLVEDFLKQESPLLKFTRIQDVPLDQVRLLVIIDTYLPKKIGVFSPLIDNSQVEVHICDHHLSQQQELKVSRGITKKRGALTTILHETLLAKKVPLTPEECTLMVLGIFQDTHSLVNVSTTAEDFIATGELIKRGADLNQVSSYMPQGLNSEQLDICNELASSLESHMIKGVEVMIATASSKYSVRNLPYLVEYVVEIENLAAVFALVRQDKRVYLIGRSNISEVDVAELAHAFGGGGHERASSAIIKKLTLEQVKIKLLRELEYLVEPFKFIRDIMRDPNTSVDVTDNIAYVEKKLSLYIFNTITVLSDKKPVGLITSESVEKAIHFSMENDCAGDLMMTRFATISPDANLKSVPPLVIEEQQKIIPVVDFKKMFIGVVSRSDLLQVLHNDMAQKADPSKVFFEMELEEGSKSLKSFIKEKLNKDVFKHLECLVQIANHLNLSIYAVGGFVRDLLLQIPNQDIDIVVQGEGIPFASCLAEKFGGSVTSHKEFGTSVVILPDGYRIDVASARLEHYKHPGALPIVKQSSVKSDLFRRDFTVNSMAIKLTGANAFCLIDIFNGERDLQDKEIHVLHSLSFIEDPCRLFRAIRYEQRFGFAISKQTEKFMRNAIKKRLVDSLSGKRLFNEIKLLLNEKTPMDSVRRMQDFDLFQFVSPEMLKAPKDIEILERLESVFPLMERDIDTEKLEVWYVYFLGFFYSLDEEAFFKATSRLHFPTRIKKSLKADIIGCRASMELLRLNKKWGPKEIYHVFSNISVEAVVFLITLSSTDRLNEYVNIYFSEYHGKVEPSLKGDDLVAMGLKPGPVFQSVFNALQEARVMGSVNSREEEVALVEEKFLKSS